MATTLDSGFCYCGDHTNIVYVEQLGRWQCPTCLFNLFKNDEFVAHKPGDGDVRCEDCNTVISGGNRALCENCIDSVHDYCHDECNNGCWDCGDSPELVACYSCLESRDEEIRADDNVCDGCGNAADYKYCVECFNAEVGSTEAAFITDEGVITVGDIEINWAN